MKVLIKSKTGLGGQKTGRAGLKIWGGEILVVGG